MKKSDYRKFIVRGETALEGAAQDSDKFDGLLRDDFGEMQRSVARRRVIEELKLANDTFIVMACGTIDQRKGADHFVTVALRFLGTVDGPRPACFVWVGGGARSNTSPYAYAMVEIRSAGRERQILFVDQRPDIEQFYVASDVFLLTARADPFPCVVHEAMASHLPVIAFEDAGGAPELIGSKAGFCVPFGDTHAMCDRLVELYKNEERRAQIGAAAQQIIKEQWTASRYFLFMLDLVATVTGLRAEEFGNPSEERVPASHRVFFLNADWGLSGVNTFSENLAEELNRLGFQAEILFTRGRFTYLDSIDDELVTPRVPARYIQPQGVRHPVGHLLTTPNAIWASLERFLLREQPCVVIPNYDYVASAISPVLPDGVAIVGIAHSDHREHYEHVYRLGRFWNRIVAVSSRIADQVVEDNPGFSPRLVTIPYGVPSADLTAAEIEQNKAKPGEPLSLLYAGRFEVEQKNILDYVKLARQLLADGRRFTLTMCGKGSQHAAVMASLRGLANAGLAEVTGRLSQAELAARLLQ
jgi:glycosyltransferase involved in cell wall biosynthesis